MREAANAALKNKLKKQGYTPKYEENYAWEFFIDTSLKEGLGTSFNDIYKKYASSIIDSYGEEEFINMTVDLAKSSDLQSSEGRKVQYYYSLAKEIE